MPKNIEEFIIPEKKRSIRDIPIPDGRKKIDRYTGVHIKKPSTSEHVIHGEDNVSMPPPPPESPMMEGSSKKFPRKRLWGLAVVAVLVLTFAVLSFFNGATLAYVPKSASLTFNNEAYTAYKTGDKAPLYSVVKISLDDGVEVPVSGEEQVSRKASGTIVIYNDASTESQRLIATTRFETSSGLVYRIKDAVVVPGKKTVNGKTQPGSVEAVVYADEAGESYNISLSDFTLPGLKGSSKFETIYARSKTPMSGGFVGLEKIVSESALTQSKEDLENSLRSKLIAEANQQVPEDLILIPALSSFSFEDLPQSGASTSNSVTVNRRGNLNGVMFKKSDLSKQLALKKISLSNEDSVNIKDIESLSFSFIGTPPANILAVDEISFTVSGTATLVWKTDEVSLKSDLVGKSKGDMPSILNNYPTVESASATIRPFWLSSFPDQASLIEIKEIPVQ